MDAEVPAEMEFITNAVQPEPDVDRLEALTAWHLDWRQVVREAVKRHDVGPLLYRNLVESGSDELVPDRVVERLHRHSRKTATRNLSMTNSLLSILEHFEACGIPALPYKGPVLSAAVYGDLSLRRSRDLDILIRPADVHDAEAVLLERGFEPKRKLTEKQKRLLVKSGRHRTLKKEGTSVELHPRIVDPDPPFEVTPLLERAGSVDLAGDSVPAMRAVDTLLALSVHGTWHRWNQLKWICDVAYLVQNEAFDWPVVLEESKRGNCYRRVLFGCGLAAAVLEVTLPEVVHSRLQDTELRLIDSTYPDCVLSSDSSASLRYRLRSRDTAVERVRYCWKELTTPPVRKTNTIPIPERFFELHYLIQPIRAIIMKLTKTTRKLASKFRPGTK